MKKFKRLVLYAMLPIVGVGGYLYYLNKISVSNTPIQNTVIKNNYGYKLDMEKYNIGQQYINKINKEYRGIDSFSKKETALAFVGSDYFLALSASVEGFSSRIYKDPANGYNIGYGYNISHRIKDHGANSVYSELVSVGVKPLFAASAIVAITNNNIRQIERIKKDLIITNTQALALTKSIESEYRILAHKGFGSAYSDMSDFQQATLTYLSYKTGNISEYKNAIKESKYVHKKGLKYDSVARHLKSYYKDRKTNKTKEDKNANNKIVGLFKHPNLFVNAVVGSEVYAVSETKHHNNSFKL